MSRKKVVVIGGGQGGLSAAVHARLNGHDVLLIEKGIVGGKAAQLRTHGYLLDPGPSIVILPEIYRDVFRRAGKDPASYLKFAKLSEITKVFFGDSKSVALPGDRKGCLEVAKSLSQEDGVALKNLLSELDGIASHIQRSVFAFPLQSALQLLNPHLVAAGIRFSKYRSYKDFVDERFQTPVFRAFFYGFPSYGGQTYDSRSLGSLLIPYFMLQEGVFYPEGGVGAIPAAFRRLAEDLGVEVREGVLAKKLTVKGSRVEGMETSAGPISCDAVICNVDRLTAERDLLGRSIKAKPSFSYFTIHWGLNRRLADASHHMLLVPDDYKAGFEHLYRENSFPEPPIIYLNVTSELDPATAPPGGTNLFTVVSSPACGPDLDWDVLSIRGRELILSSLARIGWSIREDDIVFERIQTPEYFRDVHGNYEGSLYGPQEKERSFGGLFPLKCKDDRLDNLFYAGGSVQPGAGLPMVTLSGKFAADLLGRA